MTTCSLSSPSTLCREAHGSCDLPEKCDGISTQCPQDNIKPNWESCNDKGYAVCFFGECKSHSSQCADIWGDDSYSAHDSCYDLNEAGEICMNDLVALLCAKRLPLYLWAYICTVKCFIIIDHNVWDSYSKFRTSHLIQFIIAYLWPYEPFM